MQRFSHAREQDAIGEALAERGSRSAGFLRSLQAQEGLHPQRLSLLGELTLGKAALVLGDGAERSQKIVARDRRTRRLQDFELERVAFVPRMRGNGRRSGKTLVLCGCIGVVLHLVPRPWQEARRGDFNLVL
jgi:hypothetical protein